MEMKQSRRSFVRTLFVASQAVVASRFMPGDVLAAPVEPPAADGLKFLVVGDWGRNGERNQTEVATQMARAAKTLSPRFVISVGDNFYEDGVADIHDPQWQTSFERVYADPALQVPWYVILGNHDYRGNCEAQLAYGASSHRWQMPARYFQQSHRLADGTTADFFYLDTSPMLGIYHDDHQMGPQIRAQDVPRQLAWFKAALAASTAQWKIVFAHHPIYSGGIHSDTAELIQNILPLLHEHQVQVYFNGHDHDLQHLVAGKLNLFCSGAGSEVRFTFNTQFTKFSKAIPGFTTVNLAADTMDVRMIDHHGRQLYQVTIPRETA
jgi:acid phosphatase